MATSKKKNADLTKQDFQVVGFDGESLGTMSLADAINEAKNAKLDLVLMTSKDENPAECLISDCKKLEDEQKTKTKADYEQEKKAKTKKFADEKQKKQQEGKDVKFNVNVDEHDYERKLADIKKHFEKGYNVRVTVTLIGRQKQHPEVAEEVMKRVIASLKGFGKPNGKTALGGSGKGYGLQLFFNVCKKK